MSQLQDPSNLMVLLAQAEMHQNTTAFEGLMTKDCNIPGHQLLVESPQVFYSFNRADIVKTSDLGAGKAKILVRNGARAFRSSAFNVGGTVPHVGFTVGMESLAPPALPVDPNAPTLGTMAEIRSRIANFDQLPSLAVVAANYTGACDGGDAYENNCAHFLSNAFIRAGYTELYNNNPNINARCPPARRPIRARDMWSWFQTKAATTSNTLQRNTGWWAAFQLDESEYWGGHVALFDSDNWKYYGTGWYPQWNQYLYQW